MKNVTAWLPLCEENQPVIGGFLQQKPVMQGFDGFFDMRRSKQLNKQPRR